MRIKKLNTCKSNLTTNAPKCRIDKIPSSFIQKLEDGIKKSVEHGITLSVFKRVTKDTFPIVDISDDVENDWDNEDLWTHRFECWCYEILLWRDGYNIDERELKVWAEDYVNGVYE